MSQVAGFSTDYKGVERFLRFTANKMMMRLAKLHISCLQFEDVLGELNIAYCIARDRYNPQEGVPFIAYLKRGMHFHMNSCIRNLRPDIDVSFDAEIVEDANLHEVVADERNIDPLDRLVALEHRQRLFDRMSPLTRKFVELLENPPVELVAELKALQARADYAKTRGIRTMPPKDVTINLVFQVMDCSATQRKQITTELRRLTSGINQK